MADPLITIDSAKTVAALRGAVRQMRSTASAMLNDLAFKVQRVENFAMLQVFNTPRAFTARSVLVNKSDRGSLSATIYVRPEVAKYLDPYEVGGLHVLPGPALLKPVDIKLDPYGQLPNKTMERLRARPDIYIGPIKTKSGDEINGVWQRLSVSRKGLPRRKRLPRGTIYHPKLGALRLLIRFGVDLPVKKHLNFHARAVALIAANSAEAFKAALVKTYTTAR
ncbi:MAG TPA: hypothetical protein VK741_25505 [Acetobacteraceae bacterium]|nr:hypothetical protein [Acetobacteraceae bacterium]